MPQPTEFRFHTVSGRLGWPALLAGLALLVSVGLVITVLAVGFTLFVLPALLVMGLIYYLFPGLRRRGRMPDDPSIIDAEYTVLDAPRIEREQH